MFVLWVCFVANHEVRCITPVRVARFLHCLRAWARQEVVIVALVLDDPLDMPNTNAESVPGLIGSQLLRSPAARLYDPAGRLGVTMV